MAGIGLECSMENRDEIQFAISVVIPAYNAGRHLARTIDSVLAQTFCALEIIVVDDGSTDDTAEVARTYGSKIRYIAQNNAGASVARNTGIEAAKGEWIAFLDADDEWLPEKLAKQTELLERNPDLVWTTGNFIDCACSKEQRSPHVAIDTAKGVLGGKEYSESFFKAFRQNVWGCTDTMLIRRDVLFEAGLFRRGQLRGNDYDMWWRIAYRWPKIGYLAEPLAVYHLDVEGSIIRTCKDGAISRDLIQRHLELARQHGRADDFRPCAIYLLRRWMRAMLFEARGREVRAMIRQFDELLPGWYKAFMRLFAAFPRTTAAGCRMISRIVRLLGLRKRPVRSR